MVEWAEELGITLESSLEPQRDDITDVTLEPQGDDELAVEAEAEVDMEEEAAEEEEEAAEGNVWGEVAAREGVRGHDRIVRGRGDGDGQLGGGDR